MAKGKGREREGKEGEGKKEREREGLAMRRRRLAEEGRTRGEGDGLRGSCSSHCESMSMWLSMLLHCCVWVYIYTSRGEGVIKGGVR